MGLSFELTSPTRIIFGNGALEKVPGLVADLGDNALIVTGSGKRFSHQLCLQLKEKGIETRNFVVCSEPTTDDISEAVQLSRKHECNVVIGLGGGSAIDAAKAIAAMATNQGDLTNYLEVIGKNQPLTVPPLPCIAIPTTAGTGSEVTKNAVLKSVSHSVKVSLRSEMMYPKIAVIDPQLSMQMSPELTAFTGIDALTHLLETFVSASSNPYLDMICKDGLTKISGFLERAFLNGNEIEARENMAFAAMLGGVALANGKLGAVHGFAGPLGGMFPASHGAICACLLPAVMKVNIETLKNQGNNEKLERFRNLAMILTGNEKAVPEDGTRWVETLVKKLSVPSLSAFNVTLESFSILTEKAKNASSMKGNPVLLNDRQLLEILDLSLHF
jgi:alcohol dehydrogenase class IV